MISDAEKSWSILKPLRLDAMDTLQALEPRHLFLHIHKVLAVNMGPHESVEHHLALLVDHRDLTRDIHAHTCRRELSSELVHLAVDCQVLGRPKICANQKRI